MSVPARVKTWSSGETVSASDLNTEFNIAINALTDGTSELTALSLTAGTLTTSGNVTFGDTTTDTATVAGDLNANKIKMSGAVVPGWISNLGLTLSSGRLTITDAAGSALSASNYGYVACPGATAGTLVSLKATAGGILNDASNASPSMTTYEWGIGTTTNWASAMPFFLYAVNRNDTAINGSDGNSCFAITRNPAMATTPSSANSIGDTDAVPATDDQLGVILLGSYTQANYVSLPCQLIGAIRMTYATATHDWTISALGNNDGFGATQLAKTFATLWTFPQAQNGGATGTYFKNNGGTAPTFTTNYFVYRIDALGNVRCDLNIADDGGTDGAGAVSAQVSLPYAKYSYGYTTSHDILAVNSVGSGKIFVKAWIADASTSAVISSSDDTAVTNAAFSNGDRYLIGPINYKAF